MDYSTLNTSFFGPRRAKNSYLPFVQAPYTPCKMRNHDENQLDINDVTDVIMRKSCKFQNFRNLNFVTFTLETHDHFFPYALATTLLPAIQYFLKVATDFVKKNM